MKRLSIPILGSWAFLLLFAGGSAAVEPGEALADPALEARARSLSAQLRCMVCRNQSIDDSDAELARDLRVLVRERLADGQSDRQVLEFVVQRYGEFVLLKPRFNLRNALLWGAPVLILTGGALLLLSRRPASGATTGQRLTAEEVAALAEILRRRS